MVYANDRTRRDHITRNILLPLTPRRQSPPRRPPPPARKPPQDSSLLTSF